MGLIDFILNIAGLLLWMNWRAMPFDPLTTATPATLIGTLRRAEPPRVKRWHFIASLGALLLLRAEFYRFIGPALNWTASLNLFATRLAFRSDSTGLMMLYSGLSFGLVLGVFFLWLLLLSLVGRGGGEHLLPLRLARANLGCVVDWPAWRKCLLPWVTGFALWWVLTWPCTSWGLVPRPVSESVRAAQAALVGLGGYFALKYLLLALLGLHLLHNHVYFGPHPIWKFVDLTARRLLRPLQSIPLRVGKVDWSPLVGIIVVLLFAHFTEHGIRTPTRRDLNGRPERPAFEVPGLVALYERVAR